MLKGENSKKLVVAKENCMGNSNNNTHSRDFKIYLKTFSI